MEYNAGAGGVDQRLLHGKGQDRHPPVPFDNYLFKPSCEELHPVPGIEHHAFFERGRSVLHKRGFPGYGCGILYYGIGRKDKAAVKVHGLDILQGKANPVAGDFKLGIVIMFLDGADLSGL
jgi:hypothetical protein